MYGFSYEWRNAMTLFLVAPLAPWPVVRAAARRQTPRYRRPVAPTT